MGFAEPFIEITQIFLGRRHGFEGAARKQLARDTKRVALRRMEDAARTAADLENVNQQWDHLDANRERKQRHYGLLRS